MSALDKSPGVMGVKYVTLGDTSLGTSTTSTRIGGAAGEAIVPSGMDRLLGIWAHMSGGVLTDDQAINAWGYLDTEDGFNLKPLEFLYPNTGCMGGTPGSGNANPGIFYPINCPVVPGGRIQAYGQCYEANTAEPYAAVTFMFGKNIMLPKMLDNHPGRQRWRKVGHTAAASVAAGFGPEVQYQFTLSALGGQITEVGALEWTTTQAPAQPGMATVQINSADVPVFPMEFQVNGYGSVLGDTGSHKGLHGVTRRACSAFGEKVVHIDANHALGAALAVTTGFFVSMVEFVRRNE